MTALALVRFPSSSALGEGRPKQNGEANFGLGPPVGIA